MGITGIEKRSTSPNVGLEPIAAKPQVTSA
jgi:hypothetical protein